MSTIEDDPREALSRAIEQVGPNEVLRAIRGERMRFPSRMNPNQEQAVYRRVMVGIDGLSESAMEDVFEEAGFRVNIPPASIDPDEAETVRIVKSGGVGTHDYDATGMGLFTGTVPEADIRAAKEAVYEALNGIGPYIPDGTPVAVLRYDERQDESVLNITYDPREHPAREVGEYEYVGRTWTRNHSRGQSLRDGVNVSVGPFVKGPFPTVEQLKQEKADIKEFYKEGTVGTKGIEEDIAERESGRLVARDVQDRWTWAAPLDMDDVVRLRRWPTKGFKTEVRRKLRDRGVEFGPQSGTVRAGPYIYNSDAELIGFDLKYIRDNWRGDEVYKMQVCIDVLEVFGGEAFTTVLSIRSDPYGSNIDNAIYVWSGFEAPEAVEAFNRAYIWMSGENPNSLAVEYLETIDRNPDLVWAVEEATGATASVTKQQVAAELNEVQAEVDDETEGLGSVEDDEAMTERTGGDPTEEESEYGLSPDTGDRGRGERRGRRESASDDDREEMSLSDFGSGDAPPRSSDGPRQSSLTGDTDVDERDVFSNREDSERRRREREQRDRSAQTRRRRQGDTDVTRFSGDDLSSFEVGAGLDEEQAIVVDAVVNFYEENITGDAGSIPETLGVRLTREAQDGADLIGDFSGVVEPVIREVAQEQDFPDMAADRALDMVVDAINEALDAGGV